MSDDTGGAAAGAVGGGEGEGGGQAAVKQHYDALLGKTYTWMMGGAPQNFEENASFFQLHGLAPSAPGAKALDLGAGSGFQSIPLTELGYNVTAIDMSKDLLEEMQTHKAARPSTSTSGTLTDIQGDILSLPSLLPDSALASFDLAICMGDTITHLQSMQQVRSLISDTTKYLKPGGTLVLHFRDLTYHLPGMDRFLPCRSDVNNIFTCVLEYPEKEAGSEDTHVLINDLLYTRPDSSSPWTFQKSQFKKLEVAPSKVINIMQAEKMEASLHTLAFGLVAAIGVKK